MKNLIRLSWLLLLLGGLPGCTRENPSNSSIAPREDQAAPPPEQTASYNAETPEPPAPAPAPAPRPAPAPARPRPATRPSSRPAEAPSVSEPVRVDRSAPVERADNADRTNRENRTPSVEMQTIPAGTKLTVVMSDEVSTATSKDGDTFNAALAEPLVVDGQVVAERGDKAVGKVSDVVKPGKVKGRAQLTLVLTELSTKARTYKIKTEPFVAIAVDNKERDAAIIAGGAGVGAAIGAITGGKKGAAIGAVVGGGGGTATVLATPGQSMKIEPETKVNFVLDNDVRLPVIRNRTD